MIMDPQVNNSKYKKTKTSHWNKNCSEFIFKKSVCRYCTVLQWNVERHSPISGPAHRRLSKFPRNRQRHTINFTYGTIIGNNLNEINMHQWIINCNSITIKTPHLSGFHMIISCIFIKTQEEMCDLKQAAPFQNVIPKPFVPIKGKIHVLWYQYTKSKGKDTWLDFIMNDKDVFDFHESIQEDKIAVRFKFFVFIFRKFKLPKMADVKGGGGVQKCYLIYLQIRSWILNTNVVVIWNGMWIVLF